MKTVHKFFLQTTDSQEIYMPRGAKVLAVQIQHENPYLWALVDTEVDSELRRIETRGTGHDLNEQVQGDMSYLGTYQLQKGLLVFHVFERVEGIQE